jgi:hypothetical protein
MTPPRPLAKGEMYVQGGIFLQVVSVNEDEVVYRCRDLPRNYLGPERRCPRHAFEEQITNGTIRRAGRIVKEGPWKK